MSVEQVLQFGHNRPRVRELLALGHKDLCGPGLLGRGRGTQSLQCLQALVLSGYLGPQEVQEGIGPGSR